MTPTRTLRCALTLLLLLAGRVDAQQKDAFLLPAGTVRLMGIAEFSRYDALFAEGARATLPGGILEPLTAARFAPLAAVEPALSDFFSATARATGAGPVELGPENFLLGRVSGGATVSHRVVPLGLRLGVIPRVEIGVMVPVQRGELLVAPAPLIEGTLGGNPDPERNEQLLGRIDARFRALGGSRFLPTDSSALGRELQRRVRLLTGTGLQLPDSTLRSAEFQEVLAEEFGLAPFASRDTPWGIGDVEVDVRVQLLNTLGRDPYPRDSARTHLRVALGVGARFPTGVRDDTLRLVDPMPQVGLSGGRIGVDADLFVRRLWLTVGAQFAALRPVEIRRWAGDPGAPFASGGSAATLRWTPGPRLDGWIIPRFRLNEEISLGAEYALRAGGASTLEVIAGDGSALDPGGGSAHALGISARYSTLAAHAGRRAALPVEAEIGYRRAFAGSGGAPRVSAVTLRLSLFHSLWGSGRPE